MKRLCIILMLAGPLAIQTMAVAKAAIGGLNPDKIYTADKKKSHAKIRDGLITGGDQAINDVIILGIRHSTNKGFERVVLDIEGNKKGEPVAIKRPPYYHVAVSPEMGRLVVTVWGGPKLAFDTQAVLKSFQKSKLVKRVELLPVLERDRWTFILHLSGNRPVEVFELADPVRIIMDIHS